MNMVMLIGLGLLGAVMGSFVGAQVWRVRARQLKEDKAAGEKVDTQEWKRLKPLLDASPRHDRSRCLSCQQTLRWHDLLPVVSWLRSWGRCRYCGASIGWTEFLLEVLLAALWVLSVWCWPEPLNGVEWARVAVWLVALVFLAFLFVYDRRWSLLPDVATLPFIGLGALFAGVTLSMSSDMTAAAWSLAGSVLILSGLYAALYVISRGAWIGFGDVKLGLGLALFLGDWKLAFFALFMANFIGSVLVLPSMVRGTLSRNAKIPFGPLLIMGFLTAWFFGPSVVAWYGLIL